MVLLLLFISLSLPSPLLFLIGTLLGGSVHFRFFGCCCCYSSLSLLSTPLPHRYTIRWKCTFQVQLHHRLVGCCALDQKLGIIFKHFFNIYFLTLWGYYTGRWWSSWIKNFIIGSFLLSIFILRMLCLLLTLGALR